MFHCHNTSTSKSVIIFDTNLLIPNIRVIYEQIVTTSVVSTLINIDPHILSVDTIVPTQNRNINIFNY